MYSDINTNYSNNGLPLVLTDESDIQNSILNILNTELGSRPWLRAYGVGIEYYLFAPVTAANAHAIRALIVQALTRWEPRITVLVSATTVTPNTNRDGYSIVVHYEMPNLNSTQATGKVALALQTNP